MRFSFARFAELTAGDESDREKHAKPARLPKNSGVPNCGARATLYLERRPRITIVFSEVSSKEPRGSKGNSRRRIHEDPSLIDDRQVDSYSRPKEIPSSMEADTPP